VSPDFHKKKGKKVFSEGRSGNYNADRLGVRWPNAVLLARAKLVWHNKKTSNYKGRRKRTLKRGNSGSRVAGGSVDEGEELSFPVTIRRGQREGRSIKPRKGRDGNAR